METIKVSLLLPVYNSFSYERSDGKALLPIALNSLLRQSYTDFELIILDNRSTDDTPKICKEYAAKDSRIRYIVDDKKRFAEEAISRLGELARGEYCLIVNDDDVWEKRYLEKTVSYLDRHPDIDLVHGSALIIDIHNHIVGNYFPPKNETYGHGTTELERIVRYTDLRNVVPINFGLFRTKVFRDILPYEDFDTLKSNVDNVLMLNFFMRGYKAAYIKDLLFFYRRKSRRTNPSSLASNMPPISQALGIWLFYVNHQLLFHKKILSLAAREHVSDAKIELLRTATLVSCMINIFGILKSLEDEMGIQDQIPGQRKIMDLLREYKIELRSDLDSYPSPEELVDADGEISIKNLDTWNSKIAHTLTLFKKIIHSAYSQEQTKETSGIYSKINAVIDAELGHYGSFAADGKKTEMKAASAPNPKFRKNFSIKSLKKTINAYPALKIPIIFLRNIYLDMRFLPSIFYTK